MNVTRFAHDGSLNFQLPLVEIKIISEHAVCLRARSSTVANCFAENL